jgi:hypothetical protein
MNWRYIVMLVATIFGGCELALILAKLVGHIHASWTLVLAPIWGPIVVVIVLIVIAIALFGGAQSRGENPFQ